MSALPPMVERVLRRTPVGDWRHYAVLVDEEDGSARLMARGELAAWLRANDVRDLADEASARRVPPGGLLVLFIGGHGPRFVVVGGERRAPGVPRGRTAPVATRGVAQHRRAAPRKDRRP